MHIIPCSCTYALLIATAASFTRNYPQWKSLSSLGQGALGGGSCLTTGQWKRRNAQTPSLNSRKLWRAFPVPELTVGFAETSAAKTLQATFSLCPVLPLCWQVCLSWVPPANLWNWTLYFRVCFYWIQPKTTVRYIFMSTAFIYLFIFVFLFFFYEYCI